MDDKQGVLSTRQLSGPLAQKGECRLLFVHNSPTRFVKLDLALLSQRYSVTELCLRSRWLNLWNIWRLVRTHDVTLGWFASWHTFFPMLFARVRRKPSLLIVGGYDLANMSNIGYGHQRGGPRKWFCRATLGLARCLVTNSYFSKEEARRTTKISPEHLHVVHHGVPDVVSLPLRSHRERLVLTVGNVDVVNLKRKGHEVFVRAAALLPDVRFLLVGAWQDDAIRFLKNIAPRNVSFCGWIDDDELLDYYLRSSVYVQPSLHEGFGMSVAEAMLAGCIPVVSNAGALPEVVGDCGIYLSGVEPTLVAEAVKQALESSEYDRIRARERVLEHFPLRKRRESLEVLVEHLREAAEGKGGVA